MNIDFDIKAFPVPGCILSILYSESTLNEGNMNWIRSINPLIGVGDHGHYSLTLLLMKNLTLL